MNKAIVAYFYLVPSGKLVHQSMDTIKYFLTYEDAEAEGNTRHDMNGTHWTIVRVEHIKYI